MRNIILLIAASMLIYTGCTEQGGLSYPTGYNTPGGAFTLNVNKTFNIGGLSCAASADCLAVYTSNSAGEGLAVSDGTTKLKIFKAPADSVYTIQKSGGATCSGTGSGTLSVNPEVDGSYTVTLPAGWGTDCGTAAAQTARAVVY